MIEITTENMIVATHIHTLRTQKANMRAPGEWFERCQNDARCLMLRSRAVGVAVLVVSAAALCQRGLSSEGIARQLPRTGTGAPVQRIDNTASKGWIRPFTTLARPTSAIVVLVIIQMVPFNDFVLYAFLYSISTFIVSRIFHTMRNTVFQYC